MRFGYKLEYIMRMVLGIGGGLYAAYWTWASVFGNEFPEEPLLLSLAAGWGFILYMAVMALAGAWAFDKVSYRVQRLIVNRQRRGSGYGMSAPATAPPQEDDTIPVEDEENMKAIARKIIRLG